MDLGMQHSTMSLQGVGRYLCCWVLGTLYIRVTPVDTTPVYHKHHHMALGNDHVYASRDISGVFECEKICSEDGPSCVAANMYYYGTKRYGCELIRQLPLGDYLASLTPNRNGKCIIKSANVTDDCLSDPCQYGGTCVDEGKGYRCDCVRCCSGVNCQIDSSTECDSNPCQAGGTCRDLGLEYQCDCVYPNTGISCETFVTDYCSSSPCLYAGTCSNLEDGYYCTCQYPYNGTQCETDTTDECASTPCMEGGTCTDMGLVYQCECVYPYNGTNCEIDSTGECESSPCQHSATCRDLGLSYYCICPYPYSGEYCESDTTGECASTPCMEGGTCTDMGLAYQCECVYPYNGTNCETDMTDECTPNPCFNNGVCTDHGLDYTCTCNTPNTGDICQFTPCLAVTCDNGGSCMSDACLCTPYCFGSVCETCILGTQRPTTTSMIIGTTTCTAPVEDNWIILMRRMDGSVDFYRRWDDYKVGFGNLATEFWLGNDCLNLLTNNGSTYVLRADMVTSTGEWKWAEYTTFSIGPETDKYRLTISGYTGTAGDSMMYPETKTVLNGMEFTTRDKDNDRSTGLFGVNCAKSTKGAWWHNECGYALFTGVYGPGQDSTGIKWKPFEVDLPFADLKIKIV